MIAYLLEKWQIKPEFNVNWLFKYMYVKISRVSTKEIKACDTPTNNGVLFEKQNKSESA